MSTEQKYYMTERQIDHLMSLNKTISIISPIFSIFAAMSLVNIMTAIFATNRYSNSLIFLFGWCALISGLKLFITIKDKKELIQKIKETAHYEIKITEKNQE